MTRVLFLVEGQTEEAFVNRVLKPHLQPFGVFAERASLLRTREPPAGSPYKGGVTTFDRLARDAQRLLNDSNAIVTTLIDLYGLPEDFPGLAATGGMLDPVARALHLEAAFAQAVGDARFHPFLVVHEFEALVFAVPDEAERTMRMPGLAHALRHAAVAAGGPERVNNNPATIPSRRLDAIARRLAGRSYSKRIDGPDTLIAAGLAGPRVACPHFGRWLDWLESLGTP